MLADWKSLGYTKKSNLWNFIRMQYKIPVQIENEDPIIGNISLRQIIIMMGWGAI